MFVGWGRWVGGVGVWKVELDGLEVMRRRKMEFWMKQRERIG